MNNKLFKNKYRIKSARLENYDYSREGYYFVTICTRDKKIFFGNVIGDRMVLNELGKMVEKYWLEIPEHFNNIYLDEYVVMPNHIHGIIIIDNDNIYGGGNNDEQGQIRVRRDEACLVSTVDRASQTDMISQKMQKISPKPKSLSVIVGSYKSSVTRESKSINKNFAWQSRFYDHIIRNEKSLNNIRAYIYDNPIKWEYDRNNLENIWM